MKQSDAANLSQPLPTVSVVIPTYNRARFIEKAINSVFQQTYSDIEVIIVDDCSSDNTEQVIGALTDPRVRYIRHHVNKGAPAARNSGIRAAEGDYIAFLDSDDEWLPEKLEKQLAVMKESPFEPELVSTGLNILNARGNIRQVLIPDPSWRGHVYHKFLDKNLGCTSATLVKKTCFDSIGLFDESLPAYQDNDLWLRIAKRYPVDFVAEPLTYFYEHDGERITKNLDARIQGRNAVFGKIEDDLKQYPEKLARFHYETGALHFDHKNLKEGRKYMLKSLRTRLILKAGVMYLLSFINRKALNYVRNFSFKYTLVRWMTKTVKRSL